MPYIPKAPAALQVLLDEIERPFDFVRSAESPSDRFWRARKAAADLRKAQADDEYASWFARAQGELVEAAPC